MANTVKITGTFTSFVNDSRIPLALNTNVTTTGSNRIIEDKRITTGSWQSLNTSSLNGVSYIYANTTTADSVVKLATDNVGTKIIAILNTDKQAIIPWSGSLSLYAASSSSLASASYVNLQYCLAEY